MEKKAGRNGKEIKSNATDNESAVIHTSKGYIQGCIGTAVSDAKNQVMVSAERQEARMDADASLGWRKG
jgi:hypothetical protein